MNNMLNKSFEFKSNLHQLYWSYLNTHHPDWEFYWDSKHPQENGPVVFLPTFADLNIIANPKANQNEKERILAFIPPYERHKWFRSMNSSQALAQSVFGNLSLYDCLETLSDLQDDEGGFLFNAAQLNSENFCMEFKVSYLGEPKPTSLDVYFFGEYRVAIECKFTENEVG
jgi:hypothetical protein